MTEDKATLTVPFSCHRAVSYTHLDVYKRQVRIGVWGFALPLLCLALWYLVTSLKLVPPLLVPSPTATFRRLVGLFLHEHLTSDIGATAWRWGCGYILGCLIGVPFGLFIGNSRKVYAASYPTLDFFRSLPVTALFPLFLLLRCV